MSGNNYQNLRIAVFSAHGNILPHISECIKRALRQLNVSILSVSWGNLNGKDIIDEKMIKELKDFSPDFTLFIGMNGFIRVNEKDHLLDLLKIPYIILFFDFSLKLEKNLKLYDQKYLKAVFIWDRSYIPILKKWGIKNIHYLPLATDPDYFGAPKSEPDKFDLSFIGTIVNNPQIQAVRNKIPTKIIPLAEKIIKEKINNPGYNIFSQDILNNKEIKKNFQDFYIYINYHHLAYYRKQNIYALSRHYTLEIFGPPQWNEINSTRINLNPIIDYQKDLISVFHQTKINLNFSAPQLTSSINQRIFDCLGSGNFLLTDYKEDLDYLFRKDNVEVPSFTSRKELLEKVDHYLSHGPERKAISKKIQKVILKKHTWKHRMELLLHTIHQSPITNHQSLTTNI